LRLAQPSAIEPLQRGRASLLTEAPAEGADTHHSLSCDVLQSEFQMRVLFHPPQNERICRRLRIVHVFALIDLVLLLTLVSAALTRQREIVQILGPLHGINFLLLLVIVGVGALDGIWGWWFPVAVLLTAGPPGAFLGEWIINRRMRGQNVTIHDPVSLETAVFTNKGENNTSSLFFSSTEERLLDKRKEQG
jgi:hypothetical protein